MNEYYFSFLQATCVNEASFRTPKICIVEVYYLWAWKPFYYGMTLLLTITITESYEKNITTYHISLTVELREFMSF